MGFLPVLWRKSLKDDRLQKLGNVGACLLVNDTERTWTPDEWRAYCDFMEVKHLLSSGFARQLDLANEVGLLAPLLAHDFQKAAKLQYEILKSLGARVHWTHQAFQKIHIEQIVHPELGSVSSVETREDLLQDTAHEVDRTRERKSRRNLTRSD